MDELQAAIDGFREADAIERNMCFRDALPIAEAAE
jgi:hypothetical protein